MIARIWHGRVPADRADAYYEYLLRTGVADYRAAPGNRGVSVFCRRDGPVVHFLLTSFWDSLASLHAFAGPDIDRPRYYAEDGDYLLDFEPTVTHYDVLSSPDHDRVA
jgi:hypothetical protein